MAGRILVVSDDSQFRRAVDVALSAQGHRVTVASGVSEALKAAKREPPHVLVTDSVINARTDGMALARRLKRRLPSMRCLLVQDDPLTKAAGAGGCSEWVYLFKRPFSMVRFAAATDDALRRVARDSSPP